MTEPTPTPIPNGCGVCGAIEMFHFSRWHRDTGFHQYTAPTDDQRRERMLARRAARQRGEVTP